MKILFVDIDGTLTETISGNPFKQHPQDVKVMEGADKAVAYFHGQGWRIIGISNQGGAGHKSLEDAIAEMKLTQELLPQLLTIYFCPDFEGVQLDHQSQRNPINLSRVLNKKPNHHRNSPKHENIALLLPGEKF